MALLLALLGVVALWVLWWFLRPVTVMAVHRQSDGDDVFLPVQITRFGLLKLCTWDPGVAENWTRGAPLGRTSEHHPGVFP